MARRDGKIALITGGTTGIGAVTARLSRDEGARVVVTGTSEARLGCSADARRSPTCRPIKH